MIIVPPFGLSLQTVAKIEGNFNVKYFQKVTQVKRLPDPETGSKQMLVFTESFEGIMKLSK